MYVNFTKVGKTLATVTMIAVAFGLFTLPAGCSKNSIGETATAGDISKVSASAIATTTLKNNEDVVKALEEIKALVIKNNSLSDKEITDIKNRLTQIEKQLASGCCSMMVSPKRPGHRIQKSAGQNIAATHTRRKSASEVRAEASASADATVRNSVSASAYAKMEGEVVSVKTEGNTQIIVAKTSTGEHKWTDINTNRSRCNLRNNGVIMETVFRANEAECDVWQHGRAVELGLIVPQGPVGPVAMSAAAPVVIASNATSRVGVSGSAAATCNFKLNGNVVAMTTSVDKAGCDAWQADEARRRGLTPK